MKTTAVERRLNAYHEKNQWDKAERLCRQQIKNPGADLVEGVWRPHDSHWWYIHLTLALIEQKKFAEAKDALEHADEEKGFCPLTTWYRACWHYDQKQYREALEVLSDLHRRCTRWLNTEGWIGPCWESEKRAGEIDNDCRAKIGFCHLHLLKPEKARWWLKAHLENRRRGRFSVYDGVKIRKRVEKL